MTFSVAKPTWYFVKPPFVICNADGVIFYKSTENSDGYFSLPKGTYFSEKPVKKVFHKRRKLPKLPKKERNISRPKSWKITFCDNTAKCSIKLETGTVYFDQTLWNSLNKMQKTFILLHEFGHYFYKTESKCDLFAKIEMLKLGYNKSQVATVDFDILGNGKSSFDRKCETFNAIKEH